MALVSKKDLIKYKDSDYDKVLNWAIFDGKECIGSCSTVAKKNIVATVSIFVFHKSKKVNWEKVDPGTPVRLNKKFEAVPVY